MYVCVCVHSWGKGGKIQLLKSDINNNNNNNNIIDFPIQPDCALKEGGGRRGRRGERKKGRGGGEERGGRREKGRRGRGERRKGGDERGQRKRREGHLDQQSNKTPSSTSRQKLHTHIHTRTHMYALPYHTGGFQHSPLPTGL